MRQFSFREINDKKVITDSNIIIAHGAYGHPEENWFGWLKRKLKAEGRVCLVPTLPTPKNQDLENWLNAFKCQVGHLIHSKTILIGHSLGAAFILRWLERNPNEVLSVILVGAFIGPVGDERFDDINQSFFQTPFHWSLLRNCCQNFIS